MAAHAKGAVPDNVRAAAECYLRQGYLPVPIAREGDCKGVKLDGWPGLRPRLEDLDQLFPATPPLNIGLLLGTPSRGLIDIDLDCPETIAAAPLFLPPTGWVSGRAGKPRSHWWYLVGDPPGKASEEFKDLDGTMLLELRSTGGQTVVPPSVHQTGEAIRWEAHESPAEVPLTELFAAVRATAAVALLARHWPGKGSRQDSFLALVGGLLRAGWEQDRIERFVEALAVVTRDDEPRKRARTAAQTAQKLEQQKRATGWPKLAELLTDQGADVCRRVREWLGLVPSPGPWPDPIPLLDEPDVPPFPVELLPAAAHTLVEEIAWAVNCPNDMAALPLLAMAGGALANSRHLALTDTHVHRPCLFAVAVGRPGSGKSAPVSILREPFARTQARWLDEWEQALEAWEAREEDQRGPRPVPRRCLVDDTTAESLKLVLLENPRGVCGVTDEVMNLVGGFNQYKRGRGNDRTFYVKLWNGDTIVADRKSEKRLRGGPMMILDPFCSLAGTTQPDCLGEIRADVLRTGKSPDDGFFDRFLFAYPRELPDVGERWRVVSEAARQRWAEAIEFLLGLEMVTDGSSRRPRPLLVRLTSEGRRAWEAFTNTHAAQKNTADFPDHLYGPWSKLKTYAARIALVLHFLRLALGEAHGEAVDGPSVEGAGQIVDYFKAHTRKVCAQMGTDAILKKARKVFGWFVRKGLERFSRRDAFTELRSKDSFQTVEDVEPALALLEKHALIRPEQFEPPHGRGRPPSQAYEVNPQLFRGAAHNTHNSHNAQNSEAEAGVESPPPACAHSANCANGVHTPARERPAAEPASDPPERPAAGRPAPDPGSSPFRMRARGTSLPRFLLVKDPAGLEAVRAAVDDSGLVGVDVETVGLDLRAGRVRLLSLATQTLEGSTFCYLVDCFAVDPMPLWESLAGKNLVLHNGAFDLGFLAELGFTPAGTIHDTMLLAQLLVAGTHDKVSLEACCLRWLGCELDKTQQKSNWSGALTDEQLVYAAREAEVLLPLLESLTGEVRAAGLERVGAVEQRCLPAIVWLARGGVPFDRDAWQGLAAETAREAEQLRQELTQSAPPKPGELFDDWNWDSPPQVKQALALVGCAVEDTTDSTLAGIDHPLAELLRRYRAAAKKTSTYGLAWLEHVAANGRVYPSWRQLGAVTGRMSCSAPNMQQLPRGDCRRCVAAPPGRTLIKADWSQLHLRIIAGVAPEPAMREAFRQGLDLHTLTARRLTGKEEVSKEERQRAKAAAFGLCYGMGAERFRAYARSDYGLDLSAAEAQALRREFFRAYPGLQVWHRWQPDGEVSVTAASGRVCRGVRAFSDKLAYAILLVEADCLKNALALLWERRGEVPGAFPVLACHDEIVVECDQDDAERAETWLVGALLDAAVPLLAPVPVEVSASIGSTWGGGELRAERTYRKESGV